MKKKIVILTSIGKRHIALCKYLNEVKGIYVKKCFFEKKNLLDEHVKSCKNNKYIFRHLQDRKKNEKLIFKKILSSRKKLSFSYVYKNYFSTKYFINEIKKIKPDLIIVYGTSIIKGDLLNLYKNKIINMHLGLSPYYRGSGTNYFSLVNNRPELFGTTFLFLDKGIDTGKIIHQLRADFKAEYNSHDIGNNLILKSFNHLSKLIINFKKIKLKHLKTRRKNFLFRRKMFGNSSLRLMNKNFKEKFIELYLNNKTKRDKNYPIISQKWV